MVDGSTCRGSGGGRSSPAGSGLLGVSHGQVRVTLRAVVGGGVGGERRDGDVAADPAAAGRQGLDVLAEARLKRRLPPVTMRP